MTDQSRNDAARNVWKDVLSDSERSIIDHALLHGDLITVSKWLRFMVKVYDGLVEAAEQAQREPKTAGMFTIAAAEAESKWRERTETAESRLRTAETALREAEAFIEGGYIRSALVTLAAARVVVSADPPEESAGGVS